MTWHAAILIYCFVASMLPMWVLQQPRGYLGGFVLYLAIGVGLAGVLLGGFTIRQPGVRAVADYTAAYGSWWSGGGAVTGMVLPFLFVTIACGACSGFHGLVCGGTTSKQVSKESHCKPIAFGAMLLEGLVAVIALATVMVADPASLVGTGPSQVYGDGLATFVTTIVGDKWLVFAKTFGSMAVATFIFDTLDVSTRLGRYLLQELTGRKGWVSGVVAAGLTAGVPMLVLLTASDNSYMKYWVLFGTSNQLLAGLTLLGVTVWLARQGRRYWYTLLPMLFIMAITVTALCLQIVDGARQAIRLGNYLDASAINAAVGVALLALAAVFVVEALRAVRKPVARSSGSLAG
jgi:carbon starvation protein